MHSEDFFIDDGQTVDFKIPATPGLHPELSGAYRPALPGARYTFERDPDTDGDAYVKRLSAFIRKRVVSWSATVQKGDKREPAPITAELIAKMPPTLFSKLANIVLGYLPPMPGELKVSVEDDSGN